MTNGLTLDVQAMVELARRHPDELARLRDALNDSAGTGGEPSDGPWIPCDRFDRTLSLGSLVLTSTGDQGRITRFDRNSERALVEMDKGGTRMLKLARIELRRGRPRRQSFSNLTSEQVKT